MFSDIQHLVAMRHQFSSLEFCSKDVRPQSQLLVRVVVALCTQALLVVCAGFFWVLPVLQQQWMLGTCCGLRLSVFLPALSYLLAWFASSCRGLVCFVLSQRSLYCVQQQTRALCWWTRLRRKLKMQRYFFTFKLTSTKKHPTYVACIMTGHIFSLVCFVCCCLLCPGCEVTLCKSRGAIARRAGE